jgi:ElaB/YqjD/DUF883 family membrane-anchored ribosome-binding protein
MDEATSPEELSGDLKGKTEETEKTASAAVDQTGRTGEAVWDRVKSKMSDFESVEICVREKPLRALLVTFGIGVITGLLCRK